MPAATVHPDIEQLLPTMHIFAARPQPDEIAKLPNRGAVYLLQDAEHQPILLASAQQLRRVLTTRLTEPDADQTGPRADLGAITRSIRYCEVDSVFEADWRYFRCARLLYPKDYRKRIAFGPAWFIHTAPTARIPEIRVSNAIYRDAGEFLGPFPSRKKAQDAMESLWDIFDLCRYPEQLRRTPNGQRCAYAEMGRCAAPCDGTQPLADYAALHEQAWHCARDGFDDWLPARQQEMQTLAERLEFENAGVLNGRLEAARAFAKWNTGTIQPQANLRFAILVPTTGRKSHKLFLFDQGELATSERMPNRKLADDLPAAFVFCQKQIAAANSSAIEKMEQTWLVCRFLQHKQSEKAVIVRMENAASEEDIIREMLEKFNDAQRKIP